MAAVKLMKYLLSKGGRHHEAAAVDYKAIIHAEVLMDRPIWSQLHWGPPGAPDFFPTGEGL